MNKDLWAAVMFTVSRRNYKDFIPLYRYLDELGIVDNLALDRMTAIGNGRNESDELLLPEEYRDFLFSIYKFVAIERPANSCKHKRQPVETYAV